MKFIHIFKDGKMDEIEYKDKKYNEKKIIKYLNKISKSQGSTDIRKLYSWEYDNKTILCYGWYDGEHGFENKHELPPNGVSNFLSSLFQRLLKSVSGTSKNTSNVSSKFLGLRYVIIIRMFVYLLVCTVPKLNK